MAFVNILQDVNAIHFYIQQILAYVFILKKERNRAMCVCVCVCVFEYASKKLAIADFETVDRFSRNFV